MKKIIENILVLQDRIEKLETKVIVGMNLGTKSNLQLASEMGFSPQYICDIKKGRRPLNKKFLTLLKEIK